MNWIELKRALLYGQPAITRETLQPQTVQMAVREIGRLMNFGWIEDLTDDSLQRIQTACHKNHCPEIWDEFRMSQTSFLQRKQRISSQARKRSKTPVKKTKARQVLCHS